jgi:ABC-type polysaccharide/polyol phosphate export permease
MLEKKHLYARLLWLNMHWQLLKKQKIWLDFLFGMTKKEIKVRYKNTVFGFVWIALQPLLQMIVMGCIFQFFVPVKVDNYFIFLFAGLLPWNFFTQSLNRSVTAFVNERSLIKKAKFPREVIVLSIIFSNLFHFIISLILFLMIIFGYKILLSHYSASQCFFYFLQLTNIIPAVLLLLIFTSSLSLLTASLNVRFRDINFFTQLFTTLLFYATPVIYSLNLLPEKLQVLLYFNPMTMIISLFQFAILNTPITIPSLMPIGIIIICFTVYLSINTFLKENENFDDWL